MSKTPDSNKKKIIIFIGIIVVFIIFSAVYTYKERLFNSKQQELTISPQSYHIICNNKTYNYLLNITNNNKEPVSSAIVKITPSEIRTSIYLQDLKITPLSQTSPFKQRKSRNLNGDEFEYYQFEIQNLAPTQTSQHIISFSTKNCTGDFYLNTQGLDVVKV